MKKILSTAIALFFAGAIFHILATGPAQQPGPPVAPIRPVTDTFFGHDVVDTYRWLEYLDTPETKAWIKGQADYADAFLQG
mgnify:CR=1 FL=1